MTKWEIITRMRWREHIAMEEVQCVVSTQYIGHLINAHIHLPHRYMYNIYFAVYMLYFYMLLASSQYHRRYNNAYIP